MHLTYGCNNIVQLADVFYSDKFRCFVLVMEDCGQNVHQHLLQRAPSAGNAGNSREMLIQIISGLVCLHSKNIVHGDLSAKNILVSTDDHGLVAGVKICDFGSAILDVPGLGKAPNH